MKIFNGNSGERIYLETAKFYSSSQRDDVTVEKTDLPDMPDLIARHKARYGLVALFCRPELKVLDFPCGSGYASRLLAEYGVLYEGRDYDSVTIEYARQVYWPSFLNDNRNLNDIFRINDLRASDLDEGTYDIIACIEGIEHIEQKHQKIAIEAFYKALKPGGVLIMSSPESALVDFHLDPIDKIEKEEHVSGPSQTNKYHKWELTSYDLNRLIRSEFNLFNIDVITQVNKLHTGETANCFHAVCRK